MKDIAAESDLSDGFVSENRLTGVVVSGGGLLNIWAAKIL
jgi:hypothetical protein